MATGIVASVVGGRVAMESRTLEVIGIDRYTAASGRKR
jgi:hypothetical protein